MCKCPKCGSEDTRLQLQAGSVHLGNEGSGQGCIASREYHKCRECGNLFEILVGGWYPAGCTPANQPFWERMKKQAEEGRKHRQRIIEIAREKNRSVRAS